MALLLDSWLAEPIVVLSAVTVALYFWFERSYQYWKKRNVVYEKPAFPLGNFQHVAVGKTSVGEMAFELHKKYTGERFVGYYGFSRPFLLIRDPDLVRNILVKDFATFHDRGLFFDEEEPLNKHLFGLTGYKWRQLRIKLSPAFTSGKLKGMFKTLRDCGREMAEVLGDLADSGETVEVRELAARYTTDVIASVGFGIECNTQRNPENEFRQWGRKIFQPTLKAGINILLTIVSPTLAKIFKIKANASDISKYFYGMVADTVAYREQHNYSRKDFMDLLIQLKNKGFIDENKAEMAENGLKNDGNQTKLTMDDVAAQAFIFFGAGFETSSSTMSFALHELALNTDIQTKLQQEIDSVLKANDDDINYDALSQMSYLDKVVSETLRKYPPLPILNRECNKDYRIPGTNLVLEKGTPVSISALGLHLDPEHFPDPHRFDPERFSEHEKAKRHQYVYLPFGEGPRICIGMRLGLLQTKVGLVHILSKYSVRPTEKTKLNLEYNPRSIILIPNSGIQLRLERRS